jgi:hypothetical protein
MSLALEDKEVKDHCDHKNTDEHLKMQEHNRYFRIGKDIEILKDELKKQPALSLRS